jgi:hypothetical protein
MRQVWTAPGNDTIQGNSNVLISRMMNTLKRELYTQQRQLLFFHQEENVISGGFANDTQFHYLLVPDTAGMSSTSTAAAVFDANDGETGTSQYYFEVRRDFQPDGRGY